MTKRLRTNMLRIALLGLAALTACIASYPSYPLQPIDTYVNQRESDGLQVAVHPVSKADELKTYFGSDILRKRNILPILLTIHNTDAKASFLLEPKDVQLVQMSKEVVAGQNVDAQSIDAAMAVGAVGATLISMPLLFAAGTVIANIQNLEYHMQSMELRSCTLSPGTTTQGMIYFQIPQKLDSTKPLAVQVKATNLSTRQTSFLYLPLDTGVTRHE